MVTDQPACKSRPDRGRFVFSWPHVASLRHVVVILERGILGNLAWMRLYDHFAEFSRLQIRVQVDGDNSLRAILILIYEKMRIRE